MASKRPGFEGVHAQEATSSRRSIENCDWKEEQYACRESRMGTINTSQSAVSYSVVGTRL